MATSTEQIRSTPTHKEDSSITAEKIPTLIDDTQKQSAPRPHSIDVYTVGLPGEEQLVADTVSGNQVGVRYLATGDIAAVKRLIIEEIEKAALASRDGISVEQEKAVLQEAIEATRQEAEDVASICELFEERKNAILVVDSQSAQNTIGHNDGLCLLIDKTDLHGVEARLQQLGYTIQDVNGQGIQATKGRSRFTFLYAKEGTSDASTSSTVNQDDPSNKDASRAETAHERGSNVTTLS